MLPASKLRLQELLGDDDAVLDVGGWADPLPRADWVIDVMPHATRGLYQREGWAEASDEPERFGAETWVERDVCDREPWPFADGQFDFAVCSHTLEDVRDPVWVCSEMVRVARAGYVEVPSRLEEQSYGVSGPFVGWEHHRWLIDVADGAIEFVVKEHDLHAHPEWHLPEGFWERLAPEDRVQTLWWEGSFGFRERLFLDERPGDRYLPELVARGLREHPLPEPPRGGGVRDRIRRAARYSLRRT